MHRRPAGLIPPHKEWWQSRQSNLWERNMGWDPCASCGQKFGGRTALSYVTWYEGEQRHNYRLRQCPECVSELRGLCQQVGDRRNADQEWEISPVLEQRRTPARGEISSRDGRSGAQPPTEIRRSA